MIHRAGGSFVLHERARRHYYRGSAPLSIKCFSNGRAYYDVGNGRYAVGSGTFLVLNRGREYSLTIDSKTEVESFCLFFDESLTSAVHRSMVSSEPDLLDDPERAAPDVEYVERTYPRDSPLAMQLVALRMGLTGTRPDGGWLEERLLEILESLMLLRETTAAEIRRLPAARASTREELYRRLHRARDYMAASIQQPLSLEDIAGVACLSVNHLLRSFKQAFGKSPHQYLMDLRLQEARRMLARTDLPVTEVCLAVGFESHGSFTRLFRSRFGHPPSALRRENNGYLPMNSSILPDRR